MVTLTKINKFLLNLVRTAIAGREPDSSAFGNLSAAQWREIMHLAHKQGVSALALEGVESLPAGYRPSKDVLLKWIAQLLLPAIGTLYFALAATWGLPYAEQVVGTITAIDTFLGVILGISSNTYKNNQNDG